jgi:hypothetical protein
MRVTPRVEAGRGLLAPLLLTALGALVVISRRPDALTNPQFWAEDGKLWFASTYNQGWLHPLLDSYNGYHQTLSVAVAGLSQPLGVAGAPLLFNLVAIALQILPAPLLLSRRFEAAIPSRWMRGLLGALYLLIPNFEVHVTVTNAQWHLAVLGFMVVAATPSPSRRWRALDLAVLILCGLSGPFVIPLAVVALAAWWVRRSRWTLTLAGIAAVIATVQGITALSTLDTRSPAPLGATPALLAHILVNRLLLPGLTGEQAAPGAPATASPHAAALSLVVLAAGTVAVGLALRRGPLELRLLLLFSGLLLGLALVKPMVSFDVPQWPLVAFTSSGARYFLIPVIAWTATLLWLCSRAPRLPAALLVAALTVAVVQGDVRSWRYPAYADLRPADQAAVLEAAAPGTLVTIPINPPGWVMQLRRH